MTVLARSAPRPGRRPRGAVAVALAAAVLGALLVPGGAALAVPGAATGVATGVGAVPSVLTSTEPAGPSPSVLTERLRRATVMADRRRTVPARTTPLLVDLDDDRTDLAESCVASAVEQTRHDLCTFGDTGGDRTVVLLGSSHMTMWVAGLEAAAARGGTRVVGLFKYGCSPLVLDTRRGGEAWTACTRWREWALDRVAEIDPDLVVVGTHSYVNISDGRGGELTPGTARYDRAYAGGTRRLVRELGTRSADVVFLGDVSGRPDRKRPGACMKRTGRSYHLCEHRIDARTKEMLARDRRATVEAGGRFFDSNRLTCYRSRCPVAAGGRMVFRDFSHLTRTWAVYVGDAFARRIRLNG